MNDGCLSAAANDFPGGIRKNECFETPGRGSFLLIIREIRYPCSRHVAARDDVKMQGTE
jgi:hypothetical protein